MRVITFVTQKGGSGKTTLCTNLAVVAERHGVRTLLLDLDPQASAEAWYQLRDAPTPKLVRLGAADLPRALELARGQGFDWVLIDTPGRDEPAVAAAVRAADFCLVPCRPTPPDLTAQPATVATIRRLDRPFAFILNQTPPRGFRIREAQAGLAVLGPVATVTVVARSVFQDAHGVGLGVLEYEPDGKAAADILALWQWVVRRLEKLADEPQAHFARGPAA
ncbi:Chromosome-partitioning ATPase Soj [bacterium HR40]|nr:Chromosome-partitioning ATPase Soj [bacterium HR40]